MLRTALAERSSVNNHLQINQDESINRLTGQRQTLMGTRLKGGGKRLQALYNGLPNLEGVRSLINNIMRFRYGERFCTRPCPAQS